MTEFFHRIEGLSLVDGNKAAGFTFIVSAQVLRKLRAMPVSTEEYQNLIVRMRERVHRAKLLPKKMVADCGVALLSNTACPLMFTTDAIFGGSLGANPEELRRVAEDSDFEHIWPEIEYTPHNVDLAKQALVLLILVETWAEWVHQKLSLQNFKERQAASSTAEAG